MSDDYIMEDLIIMTACNFELICFLIKDRTD